MEETSWDLIIIGAGPTGLTAGIYGARSGLDTLVIEKDIPGGAVNYASIIENYPGFPNGIRGRDFSQQNDGAMRAPSFWSSLCACSISNTHMTKIMKGCGWE